jgi:PKHD-type hydroxylase
LRWGCFYDNNSVVSSEVTTTDLNLVSWRTFDNALDQQVLSALRSALHGLDWFHEAQLGGDKSARYCWLNVVNEKEQPWADLVGVMRAQATKANAEYCFDIDDAIEEPLLLLRYASSDATNWHFDLGPGSNETRKLSVIMSLNDPSEFEGGSLEFFPSGRFEPKKVGDCIVFPSYLPHRVTSVTNGVRYSALKFFHGPRFK